MLFVLGCYGLVNRDSQSNFPNGPSTQQTFENIEFFIEGAELCASFWSFFIAFNMFLNYIPIPPMGRPNNYLCSIPIMILEYSLDIPFMIFGWGYGITYFALWLSNKGGIYLWAISGCIVILCGILCLLLLIVLMVFIWTPLLMQLKGVIHHYINLGALRRYLEDDQYPYYLDYIRKAHFRLCLYLVPFFVVSVLQGAVFFVQASSPTNYSPEIQGAEIVWGISFLQPIYFAFILISTDSWMWFYVRNLVQRKDIPFISKFLELLCDESLEMSSLTLEFAINAYRKRNGLKAVRLSPSLSHVARYHARDLEDNQPHKKTSGNLHSWSHYCCLPFWRPVAYNPDHSKASYMFSKPREMSTYVFDGFEIACYKSNYITAEEAVELWAGSPTHNAVMLNLGQFNGTTWGALGAAMSQHYASAWFGKYRGFTGFTLPYQERIM